MIPPSNSFNKFHYGLRYSKLVKRKMLIEVLLHLFRGGYDIPSYTYMGFGSVYYVDFVMFHKYLFIKDMFCFEWGDIPKRMEFNKPYKFISLKMGAILKYIHMVSVNQPYFVWLDYDRPLDDEALRDAQGFLGRLSPGSVFIVSVESRARPVDDDLDLEAMTQNQINELMLGRYNGWFGPYIGRNVTFDDLTDQAIPDLFVDTCREHFRATLVPRGLDFLQLFNYWYKDGAPMWTIGGMIANNEDKRRIRNCGIRQHPFVRSVRDPMIISVPPLTMRGKLMLDEKLPRNRLTKKMIKIELSGQFLRNYRKVYKEYPTFAETFF